jgi:hypothetical protein
MTPNSGAANAIPATCPSTPTPGRRAGRFYFRRRTMTKTNETTPGADDIISDWDTKRDAYDRLNAELRGRSKDALFDALAAAGITHVIVTFDGYGDSGQFEHVEAKAGEETVAMPEARIGIVTAVWGKSEPECSTGSVSEAVNHLVCTLLEETHCGWENNEGAYGEFTFDVGSRTITLDFNERYIESANHQQVF